MADKKDTRFKPGESGNPDGRRPGSGWVGKARQEMQKAWDGSAVDGSDGLRHVLLEKARGGDMAAIRLVAERVCAPLKAVEPTVEVPLEGNTLTERAMSVLGALGRGEIAPGQASQLLQGLGSLSKIIEADELERRIKALEDRKL